MLALFAGQRGVGGRLRSAILSGHDDARRGIVVEDVQHRHLAPAEGQAASGNVDGLPFVAHVEISERASLSNELARTEQPRIETGRAVPDPDAELAKA